MMATETDASLAYSALDPETIFAAIEALGYRCDGRLLALNSYENRVYRVGIEDAHPIVVKFYRPQRWRDAAILEEHGFAEELASAELPLVAPIRHGGTTLHSFGPFRYSVYPCYGGRSPELDDRKLLRRIGRLVARMHLVGASGRFVARPALDLDSYGIASRDYLLGNRFIPQELERVYAGVAGQVLEFVSMSFERSAPVAELRIHADFHPGNVLVRDEQIHIVDLDDTRTGPAVQDLWMFLSGDRDEQAPQLAALLEGYEDFRSFDLRELGLIEALRSLRIMHYAAWLARRWKDPAFKIAFPWFASRRYWDEHVLALREQIALMQEPPSA